MSRFPDAGHLVSSAPQLSSRTIDLHRWSCPAPMKPVFKRGEIYPPSHLVSVYNKGDVVVGFVNMEGDTLAASTTPELALHTLTFDRNGSFLFEEKFPTTMRDDNSIFAVACGNLLIRTPEMLTLWSHELKNTGLGQYPITTSSSVRPHSTPSPSARAGGCNMRSDSV